jgi:hypothetical protein
MRIEGTLRSNLIAAIASARRLRGCPVHRDTVDYWQRLLEYGRHNAMQPMCEPVADLIGELESELMCLRSQAAGPGAFGFRQ